MSAFVVSEAAPVGASFTSSLAPHLEAYLKLMRAVGRRYERVERILRQLDRFVAKEPQEGVILTRDLLGRWLASAPHLAPATLRAHASAARQFCRYMARIEPRTWIPDGSLCPARIPCFQPHIFSVSDLRNLFAAANQCPSKHWWLRTQSLQTLLLLLYATGLRINEALLLRLADVDLDQRILFVAETKFFKARWVPFSTSLAEQLHAYRAVRDVAVTASNPDDPFFISSRRRPYSYSHVHRTFQRLLQEVGIDTSATRRGRARLHDLRHTFAVHCVLRWYREGADVRAKLPLLATYLGHASVLSTHVYLHATTAILEEASQRFERAYGSLGIAPQEEICDVLG